MPILPPEWAPQSGVMLTWPHRESIWTKTLDAIDAVFVEVAKYIAASQEKLLISCFDAAHQQHIMNLLKIAQINLNQVKTYLAVSDDIWVRDHGPLVTLDDKRCPVLLDFTFNGWGNKYPAEKDNCLTRSLHAQQAFGDHALSSIDMVLEGGAIEVDGEGTLLTTSRCLLAKTRNPGMTQTNISAQLQQSLGIKRTLWLDHGFHTGDDTDSHIDTLARFVNPHTICYVRCSDPTDQHYTALKEMENQLRSFRDYQGYPYLLVPLPCPKACYADHDGRRLPATYANFLITNHTILVPTYDDPADAEALATLASCFTNRETVGIHALPVIQWYGSLHCMTMQLPQGVVV